MAVALTKMINTNIIEKMNKQMQTGLLEHYIRKMNAVAYILYRYPILSLNRIS